MENCSQEFSPKCGDDGVYIFAGHCAVFSLLKEKEKIFEFYLYLVNFYFNLKFTLYTIYKLDEELELP